MNDLEHFSLRWNNFHSNMSSGFCALLQEDALVDVTLAAEGRILQAHKLVLSVCSPYFKQLFAANPCKHPIVILKDVHHKQLSDLLNFMYQGEVNVRQEELATFLKTAELLQIKGLTEQEPQTSHYQASGSTKEDRQCTTSQKSYHLPKFRGGSVRRIRPAEKPIPFPSVTDFRSSPAPSPPPPKRVRPAASPATLGEDNERQDDTSGTAANDSSGKGNESAKVKEEPPSNFDGHSNDVGADGSEKDCDKQNASLQHSQSTPQASVGSSQETDEKLLDRTPFRLSADLNASTASSSGLSITPSENSFSVPETQQGELYYMTSKRGRVHLLHDGHRYYLHRQGVNGTRYWRCLRHRTSGCRAYVSVDPEARVATKRGRDHNHTPPYERLDHNWIPVPMKLLSANGQAHLFDTAQSYCGYELNDDPEDPNEIDSLSEVNFIPNSDILDAH